MKILLDECVDRRLAREIIGHEVGTVHQMGWAGVKNGELLTLASRSFDVFVTVDAKLPYQTTVTNLTVSVLVLRGRSSRLADLLPLIPELRRHSSGVARLISDHWRKKVEPAPTCRSRSALR